jgi:hypothetical protein
MIPKVMTCVVTDANKACKSYVNITFCIIRSNNMAAMRNLHLSFHLTAVSYKL